MSDDIKWTLGVFISLFVVMLGGLFKWMLSHEEQCRRFRMEVEKFMGMKSRE